MLEAMYLELQFFLFVEFLDRYPSTNREVLNVQTRTTVDIQEE